MLSLDNEFYLLGTYFDSEDNTKTGKKEFRVWHLSQDLTKESQLDKKIRPIPLTPVLADISGGEDIRLWGTNIEGKLMELGMGLSVEQVQVTKEEQEKNEDKVDGGDSPEENNEERVLLHHAARVEKLKPDADYRLSFPPLNLLAQMIGEPQGEGAAEPRALADNLQSFVKAVDSRIESVPFKLTKILPSQLAPAYKAETGLVLSPQQEAYNRWREKRLAEDKPIKGFLMPAMHTCAVVFSDPLYIGAEVSLIRPVREIEAGNGAEVGEEVIATQIVTAPEIEKKIRALPCALFNLDPAQVDDGFYLIRVEFWQREYEELHREQGLKLPESVKQANIKKVFVAKEGQEEPQNLFSYELHEKLIFVPSPGLGKVASVCGDMITLEETLFQLFPHRLPRYDDYMSKGLNHKAESQPGLASLSLAATISKTAESLSTDFVSHKGLKLHGTPKEIAQTIGLALWENAEKSEIPPIVMESLAMKEAISAQKDALGALQDANILARKKWDLEYVKKALFKKTVIDTDYFEQLDKLSSLDRKNGEAMGSLGRLSQSWATGQLLGKGLPAVNNAAEAYQAYQTYKAYSSAVSDAESAFKNLELLTENYLQNLAFLRKFDSKGLWQKKAELIQQELGEDARIVLDKQGIVIHLYFKFNSAVLENEIRPLYTGFDTICTQLCRLLQDNPDYQIIIEGHAGVIGTEENNYKISQRRANKISDAILSKAKNREALAPRLVKLYFGKSRLTHGNESLYKDVNDKSDSADIAIDRRVDVRLVVPDLQIALPPSRTGSMKLESIHQLWQAHMMQAEGMKDELMQSALDAMCGVAMLTPAAPFAAYYFIGQSSLELAGTAAELIDAASGQDVFEQMKTRFEVKKDLNTLAKLNKSILKQYTDVNQTIEKQVISPEGAEKELKSQVNSKELLKRFLLRAYALNSLAELMAIISTKPGKMADVIHQYKVSQFIEAYVMSDDWEVQLLDNNTLAQSWVNRMNVQLASNTGSASMANRGGYAAETDYFTLKTSQRVSGKFATGFPVQSALYLDKTEKALESFYKDFNLLPHTVDEEHIGFSRLLVWDKEEWLTYAQWIRDNAGTGNKIGPQTRIKIQVVLNKEGTEAAKTVFAHSLSYKVVDPLWDVNGPVYDVLFCHKLSSEFDDPDGAIKQYFGSEGCEQLSGTEFEPTYWFGMYEIHGLKPLCAASQMEQFLAFFSDKSEFDIFMERNGFHSMEYAFCLGDIRLELAWLGDVTANSGERPANISVSMPGTGYAGAGMNRPVRRIRDSVTYGVTDITREEKSHDGFYEQETRFNDNDFLIEEFVMSGSAKREDNTPALLCDKIVTLAAVEIGGELKFIGDWTYSSVAGQFDWAKEQSFCIYFALLGDSTAHEEYRAMRLDPDRCPVMMQLDDDGPVLHSHMYYSGEVTVSKDSLHVLEGNSSYPFGYEWNFDLEHESLLASGEQSLAGFAGKAMQYLEEHGSDYQSQLADTESNHKKKHIYVMKFDFSYSAPNGRRIKGLRPFGGMLDGDRIRARQVKIGQLRQSGVDVRFDVPKTPLWLPRGDSYFDNMLWSALVPEAKAENLSACRYWEQLDPEKRKERIREWIEVYSTTLDAPQAVLMQI